MSEREREREREISHDRGLILHSVKAMIVEVYYKCAVTLDAGSDIFLLSRYFRCSRTVMTLIHHEVKMTQMEHVHL